MKKIINNLMEKKAQEDLKKNEQIERKARLSELEEKNKGVRRKLLHPIKSVNDGKEIKKLKEDIAAFEKKKEKIRIFLALGGILGVLMIMLFAPSFFGKSSNNKADETPLAMTASEAKTENAIESITEVPTVKEEEQASSDRSVNSSTGFTGEDTDDSEKIDTDDEPIEQGVLLSDLKIYYLLDYAHAINDSIYLGNDEGVTFTIEIEKEVNDIEELVFDYDTSLLNHTVRDFDYENGKTTIIVYVKALEKCNTELLITTEYELEKKGEEAHCYQFSIRKLDSSEGRVVYVTPTGEKYHYSADCAGENAIKTTYYDVEMLETKPCGRCVN